MEDQLKNASLPQEVVKQLHLCGHFLHFRMGGKAGRRRILDVLLKRGEVMQRELQDILGVQSGSLSEMIIKMEAEGLIEKVRSQKDGRQVVLRLTSAGMEQAESMKEAYSRQTEKMMSCFSEEQLQELHNMLDTMLTHWRETEEWNLPPDREKPDQHCMKEEKKDTCSEREF